MIPSPFLARKGVRSDDASLIETLDLSEGMVERVFQHRAIDPRNVARMPRSLLRGDSLTAQQEEAKPG